METRKRKAGDSVDCKTVKSLKQSTQSNNKVLPPEILIKIFKFLKLKDLCRAASVCKTWHSIAHDETLWYKIDLSELNLSLKNLWKFIRQKYTTHARLIIINGQLNLQYKGKLEKIISPALMSKLKETCCNLKSIKFHCVDMRLITVQDLPDNIEEITLLRCEVPVNWFRGNDFKCLKLLDLTTSSRTCHTHIKDLNNCKEVLESLILSNCYRIDDRAIDLITKDFTNLKCLLINGTSSTSLSIHWICTRLKKLNCLNIENCKYINESDKQFAVETFKSDETFKLIM